MIMYSKRRGHIEAWQLERLGGTHMAFDMVDNATDPDMTLSFLRSLARGGRLVLRGSMTASLPIPDRLIVEYYEAAAKDG